MGKKKSFQLNLSCLNNRNLDIKELKTRKKDFIDINNKANREKETKLSQFKNLNTHKKNLSKEINKNKCK